STGVLTVTATTGSINEVGAGDAAADLTGATLNLTAGTAIGSTNGGLETNAVTINAAAAAGDIMLIEGNGATLGTLTSSGNITIATTTGDLTVGTVTAAGNAS